eukprot:COSAG04_NODE_269_length_18509_cov_13.576480_9_plen_381_part_00
MGKGGGTKHAKNQCTQAHYSQAERKADGYGSQKQRLGGESLLPFGTCCISLKPVVDPVVSKKGDLFSRDAIVEYLAYQKVAQQREKAAYAQQEAGKAAEAAAAEAAASAEELEQFEKQEMGTGVGKTVFAGTSGSAASGSTAAAAISTSADLGNRGAVSYNTVDGQIYVPEGDKGVVKKRPNPWAHEATGNTGNAKSSYREGQKVKVQRLNGLDADAQAAKRLEVYENERAQVKAFWIPAHTPGADAALKKPTTKGQKHPWGDYSLKFKKLVPVTFTPVDSSKQDEQHTLAASGENRFMCPVTFKTFGRATKAAVLKASGHVVHASVVDDYIKKFGECPLTGKKCTKKDVIMLKEGGTGFAAHGSESVEVTKWANAGHYG